MSRLVREINKEEINCLICGSERKKLIGSSKDLEFDTSSIKWDTVNCIDCGHYYLSPRPCLSEANNIYPSNYYPIKINKNNSEKLIENIRFWIDSKKFSFLKLGSDDQSCVIDLGCGDGRVLKTLRKMYPSKLRLIGCDFSIAHPLQDDFKNLGIEFINGLAEDLNYADLEYSPGEYIKLLLPIINDNADVVYGSRFLGGDSRRVLYFWHSIGNKFLTLLSNIFSNLNLSDMETCYKVFKAYLIPLLNLQENRFGFKPEFTAKVARLGCKIYEVSISYHGRTYEEGKKIGWKDGFAAIFLHS